MKESARRLASFSFRSCFPNGQLDGGKTGRNNGAVLSRRSENCGRMFQLLLVKVSHFFTEKGKWSAGANPRLELKMTRRAVELKSTLQCVQRFRSLRVLVVVPAGNPASRPSLSVNQEFNSASSKHLRVLSSQVSPYTVVNIIDDFIPTEVMLHSLMRNGADESFMNHSPAGGSRGTTAGRGCRHHCSFVSLSVGYMLR